MQTSVAAKSRACRPARMGPRGRGPDPPPRQFIRRRAPPRMGRPYAEEMDMLPGTYEWAAGSDISALARFVGRAAGRPLCAVGSGGSLTAATLAAVLHRQTGSPAFATTPMDLVHGGRLDGSVSVLLATSGGNNGDVAAAFEAACAAPGRNACVLSSGGGGAGDGGRVGRLASASGSALVQAAAAPAGRDGFLATISALASCVWLVRAYGDASGAQPLPAGYGRLRAAAPDLGGTEAAGRLVILHDVWGRAAAADIESKMSESGIAAAQVSDYRNFAHGQHHGLVAGAAASADAALAGVVALVSPLSRDLAGRMLSLLPESVPVCRIETGLDGPAAAVSLVASAMLAVGAFAAARGVDPGRPEVAEFGRRLYSMPMGPGMPAAAPRYG